MQKLNIRKTQRYAFNENLVLLVNKNADFTGFDLSEQEISFIKKEFEKGSTHVVLNRYTNWIVVQTFKESKHEADILEQLRKDGNIICRHFQKYKIEKVTLVDGANGTEFLLALAEGLILGNYQFIKYFKNTEQKTTSLQEFLLVSDNLSESSVQKFIALTEAVYIARDLVNEPASVLNSITFSQAIVAMGKEAGFSTEVFTKEKIISLNMGGLLAVNQGSTIPPTFSVLEWKPANITNAKPVILVGKGLVYDTGGHSLKHTLDSMDYMKSDMAGAAAVASVLYAIARVKLPLHVIGLIPATDNRISADAYSPGDVITICDGTTVEVMNTDAEGRLVLADALCYAKQYQPELVIDIATLTGAAHLAIGSAGVVGMGNAPEGIIDRMVKAGNKVYERIAVFPFWDEYGDLIKSDIADLKNTGGPLAGAITAGKFLEYFTDYPYFHIDIAGMAYMNKPDSYRGTGGTGVGVRLLFSFLNDYGK